MTLFIIIAIVLFLLLVAFGVFMLMGINHKLAIHVNVTGQQMQATITLSNAVTYLIASGTAAEDPSKQSRIVVPK